MRVDVVFPVLPPALDGIGDHTALFSRALAARCNVRVLTGPAPYTPVPGVEVVPEFTFETRSGVDQFIDAVRSNPPDWLFLQFNQFSYGKWGLNPFLPLAIRTLKRTVPGLRVAWMSHEDFVPVTSWKFAIMTTWQRWQFWMLGRYADLICFSIEPWVRKYRSWFPGKPVIHLPVGSNIPMMGMSRRDARERLGLDDRTFVVGLFGTVNASRMLPLFHRAVSEIGRRHANPLVLYVGPHGKTVHSQMGEIPVRDAGVLPAAEVSAHFVAMDLHLTPFIDGVSTRRGSFMAGIQHGLPTVATQGELTDPLLSAAAGEAFLLAPVDQPGVFVDHAVALLEQPDLRKKLGRSSKAFYDIHFSFDHAATRFLSVANEIDSVRR